MTSDAADTERVSRFLGTMYESYLAGDTTAIDQCLGTTFTMFDSARWDLVHGRAELAELRARRPSPSVSGPREIALAVEEPHGARMWRGIRRSRSIR